MRFPNDMIHLNVRIIYRQVYYHKRPLQACSLSIYQSSFKERFSRCFVLELFFITHLVCVWLFFGSDEVITTKCACTWLYLGHKLKRICYLVQSSKCGCFRSSIFFQFLLLFAAAFTKIFYVILCLQLAFLFPS